MLSDYLAEAFIETFVSNVVTNENTSCVLYLLRVISPPVVIPRINPLGKQINCYVH